MLSQCPVHAMVHEVGMSNSIVEMDKETDDDKVSGAPMTSAPNMEPLSLYKTVASNAMVSHYTNTTHTFNAN